jgi:hypothetical protein
MIAYVPLPATVDQSPLSQFRKMTRDEKREKELPVGKKSIRRKSIIMPMLIIAAFPVAIILTTMRSTRGGASIGLGAVLVIAISLLLRWMFQVKPAHQKLQQIGAPFAYEELEKDHRRPVVLLRSFEQEQSRVGTSIFGSQRIEELLVSATRRFGPTIAIGAPKDELPQLGAARAYVQADKWQAVALEWIASSRMILILAGSTRGLLWELERIIQHRHIHKTIVVCCHNSADDRRIWQNNPHWDGPLQFARRMAQATGNVEPITPDQLDDVIAIVVGHNKELVFIRTAKFTADAYERAVDHSIVELFCKQPAA